MDEKNYDRQLVEEVRALRADLRRYAVIAMWLFLGVSAIGFILFSNHASKAVIEGLASLILVISLVALAWQVGLIPRSKVKTTFGRKNQQAASAILSARTSGPIGKP
jgi:hypothetical protein